MEGLNGNPGFPVLSEEGAALYWLIPAYIVNTRERFPPNSEQEFPGYPRHNIRRNALLGELPFRCDRTAFFENFPKKVFSEITKFSVIATSVQKAICKWF